MRYILPLLFLGAAAWADEARDQAREVAKRLASKETETLFTALHEAAEHPHALLVAPLSRLLKDKEPSVREKALEALVRQPDAKGAAKAIAGRLGPLGADQELEPELLKVIQALHDLAHPVSIKPLLSDIPHDEETKIVRARLLAVGNVPSKEAIEDLLRFGSGGGRRRKAGGRQRIVVEALMYATATKERRTFEEWRRWWSENEKTFDYIGAAEKRAEARKAASEKKNRPKRKG